MQANPAADPGSTYALFPEEETVRDTAVVHYLYLYRIRPLEMAVKKFAKFSAYPFPLDYLFEITTAAKFYCRPMAFRKRQPPAGHSA